MLALEWGTAKQRFAAWAARRKKEHHRGDAAGGTRLDTTRYIVAVAGE
ncbi:hypothetical protein MJ585_08460 [Klebsiella pneumoniae]|nr:hypothetical protein MJ585_08460 [Klebsiella pneumoniae]